MRVSSLSRSSLVVVACVAPVVGASCLDLNRADSIESGTLTVTVADDGAPAAGVIVDVLTAPRTAVTNSDGVATVKRLEAGDYVLRASERAADGSVGRVGYGVGRVRADASGAEPKVTGAIAAPIVLEETGSISGSVDGCDATVLCRVVLSHEVTGPVLEGVTDTEVSLAGLVEQTAGVGTDGRYRFDDVGVGNVQLLALRWERGVAVEPRQQLIAASRPTGFGRATLKLTAGEDKTLDLAATTNADGATVEGSFALYAPGLERLGGRLDAFVPSTTTTVDDAIVPTFSGIDDGGAFTTPVPVTVADLNIQFDGDGAVPANASLLAWAPPTEGLIPVVTGLDTRCLGDDVDCDDDGILNGEDDDLDGDGILDVEEPADCVGVGRGVDLDGDCLCEPFDPFPACQSNDPVECTPAIAPVCDLFTP